MKRAMTLVIVALCSLAGASAAAPGGAGVVDGTVYTFAGAAVPGAQVFAGWRDGGTLAKLGPATTDAAGFYSLSGVPTTSLGVVQAQLPSGDYFVRKALTFVDPGTSSFDLRPGAIHFTTTRATSGWGTWKSLVVFASGSQGETRTVSASTALYGSV